MLNHDKVKAVKNMFCCIDSSSGVLHYICVSEQKGSLFLARKCCLSSIISFPFPEQKIRDFDCFKRRVLLNLHWHETEHAFLPYRDVYLSKTTY